MLHVRDTAAPRPSRLCVVPTYPACHGLCRERTPIDALSLTKKRFPPAIGQHPLALARCSRATTTSAAREAASAAAAARAPKRIASAAALPAAVIALSATARLLVGARVAALPLATQ